MTEDEVVGWHHRLSGQESEQALGVDGRGSLAWGHKESDTAEWLDNNNKGAYLARVRPQYWDA